MRPTFLITRPQPQSQSLAALLEQKGYGVFIEPILSVSATSEISAEDREKLARTYQAILATSAHALPTLAQTAPHLLHTPLWTAGEATAERARTLGFLHVRPCGGTARDLLAEAQEHLSPDGAPLLYARGRQVAKDLRGQLMKSGFSVEELTVYEAVASTALSESARQKINAGEISAALFFSARTAETFAQLAKRAHLLDALPRLTACCISAGIAAALKTLPWKNVLVSRAPSQDSLIELLGKRFPLK